MNQVEAIKRLNELKVPTFQTRDAAASLRVTPNNAHMILSRLQQQGFLVHLTRGRWGIKSATVPLILPEALSAPEPAYVSLQSALFHRGLVEQVPAVTYAVTTSRTRRVTTPVGTVSFHRLPPELFTGFTLEGPEGFKIATAEKALFDVFYLAPGRSRLFARLPEIEIPRGFRWAQLAHYTKNVKSSGRRTFINRGVAALRAQTA